MTTDDIARLIALSEQLTKNLTRAADHIAALENQLYSLEAQGMTTASATYRAGKYLYLVSPMVNGQRTREYVGNNPAKIRAAAERIDRQEKHDILKARLDAYTSQLNRTTWLLRDWVDLTNPRKDGKME